MTTMRTFDFESGEILNVDKPEGWTSFDVVKKIRKYIRPYKVGHAGTLDPFATGVLLLCVGKATKRFDEMMLLKKEYRAIVELGKATDTFDITGKVTKINSSCHFESSQVEAVCEHFTGVVEQVPPMYSAVKINGRRLYELARQGQTVERKPRKIEIYELEIEDFEMPFLSLRIICSKGTYIRSLANDLGVELGCGAYLKALTRTRIGAYRIEDSYSISTLIEKLEDAPVFA